MIPRTNPLNSSLPPSYFIFFSQGVFVWLLCVVDSSTKIKCLGISFEWGFVVSLLRYALFKVQKMSHGRLKCLTTLVPHCQLLHAFFFSLLLQFEGNGNTRKYLKVQRKWCKSPYHFSWCDKLSHLSQKSWHFSPKKDDFFMHFTSF